MIETRFKTLTGWFVVSRFRWSDAGSFPVLFTAPTRIYDQPKDSSDNQNGHQYENCSVTHKCTPRLPWQNEPGRYQTQNGRMAPHAKKLSAQIHVVCMEFLRREAAGGRDREVARPMENERKKFDGQIQ